MTIEEMKTWVDNSSYEELLREWRNAPAGDPMFSGEMGEYYAAKMKEKRESTPHGERVAASKAIGWEGGR